jgi:hypothetical protein
MFKYHLLIAGVALNVERCDTGKHETSAPHTTVHFELSGNGTNAPIDDFTDGWSVSYETFLVDMGPYCSGEEHCGGGGVFDLVGPPPRNIMEAWLVSGDYPPWSYALRVAPYTIDLAASGIPPEILGHSVYVSGSARGPKGVQKRFTWGFERTATYSKCKRRDSKSDTLRLEKDALLRIQVVLDGRALFKDELAPAGALRFAPFAAADRNADGNITEAELAQAKPPAAGCSESPAINLYDFVERQAARIGLGGEWECAISESDGGTPGCEQHPPVVTDCAAGDVATKDADGDGLRNCEDWDIDGDGVPNGRDCDPYHTLQSLSVCERDDLHLKDHDGDGLRNCLDPDIDGDGVPNGRDGDPYRDPAVTKAK